MQHDFMPALAGCALALLLALTPARAGIATPQMPAPPPIPDRVGADVLKDAPAEWRDYLIAARKADRLADPLQRCLAFPDLPGTRWPPGHAEAHCRFHAISVMEFGDIAAYVDRGDADGLEKRMQAYLAKHFSEENFGEDIHEVFGPLGEADAETDRISARWLALAPESAYANLARARFYQGSAWNARGSKWASRTPRDNMLRMTEFVDLAVPLFRKAIAIEPKLMPAYVGLLSVAMADSRSDLEREAIEGARRQDPACIDMARQRMQALQPRWGGSYEEMLSLSNELAAHMARRPHLAIHVAAPYGDRGDRLAADDEYTREAAEILDIAVAIGSNEAHLHDAGDVALNRTDAPPEPWKGLAYLLQEGRFQPGNAWMNRAISRALMRTEPEWSLIYGLRAAGLEPHVAFGQYYVAAAYYNAKRHEDAERHYVLAMTGSDYRRDALKELSTMWLYDSGLPENRRAAKAKPYVDSLAREFPKYGPGLLMQADIQGMTQQGRIDPGLLKRFLEVADQDDPWQANAYREIRAAFDKAGIK